MRLILVRGMAVGVRAVGASLLLQMMLVYVFAVAMHALLKDDEDVFVPLSARLRLLLDMHLAFL